jgi:hypothetical protein
VQIRDGGVCNAWAIEAGEVPGDEPQYRAAVIRCEERQRIAGNRLVSRARQLQLCGQVDPELHAVDRPALAERSLGWQLVMKDAGSSCHPLCVAFSDDAAAAQHAEPILRSDRPM